MPDSIDFKRECIESGLPGLSVRRQCELLGLNRSSWYYRSAGESVENLQWMRRIDEQYLKTPFYGSRKMAEVLSIDRKRPQRLMRLMGLEAIYPKPHLSRNDTDPRIYPYLTSDSRGPGFSHAGDYVRGGVRRPMESLPWSKSTSFFSEKFGGFFTYS